ncbi:hypothetical protein [Phyllobacterium brassicacearum]|uniref:hypothetical protein n=1 Tax=Phyllobacterium brassicacearum TaxID=314235 RepID=UPI0010EA4728|nr:hypothetical protein [Phyllobacterium brassicacearum]TDQ19908.1 hypothetical protein DEV91_124103 [Phyllobacterium brassicacearum]
MTSVPLHAPYEFRRSRKLAEQYDATHARLKGEVAACESVLAKYLDSVLTAEKWELN